MPTQPKADVAALALGVERIKRAVRGADARVTRLAQTTARVGGRLAAADGARARCLEAQELLAYLQAFSCLASEADFDARLPALFSDPQTMAEAAAVSRRLLQLAGDVAASKARGKRPPAPGEGGGNGGGEGAGATPGRSGGVGSIERAVEVRRGAAGTPPPPGPASPFALPALPF